MTKEQIIKILLENFGIDASAMNIAELRTLKCMFEKNTDEFKALIDELILLIMIDMKMLDMKKIKVGKVVNLSKKQVI